MKSNFKQKTSFLIKNKKLQSCSKNHKSKISFQFNGNFYISSLDFLKKYKSFYHKNKTLAAHQKSKFLSIDIDTNHDFELAGNYIKHLSKIT